MALNGEIMNSLGFRDYLSFVEDNWKEEKFSSHIGKDGFIN